MVPQSSLEHFVCRLGELAPLSSDDINALLALTGQIVQVRANADVVAAGSAVEHAYVVSHGLIARYASLRNGERQLTVLHIAGDVADLHSVPVPRATTAIQALTTSTLIRIPLASIRNLALQRPAIAAALWAYSAVDAAVLSRWTALLARASARARMAHLLCELGLRMENAGIGDRRDFDLEVTQAQLADALGITPVHVNRTLQALRKEQVIATQNRRFQIRDWDRLADIADFDPDYLVIPPSRLEAA